jgi:hypothetical protein
MSGLDTVIFVIKGWTVTLVAALVGFSLETRDGKVIVVGMAIVSVVAFLILDGYFRSVQLGHRTTNEKIKELLKRDGSSKDSKGALWNEVWSTEPPVAPVTLGKWLKDYWHTFFSMACCSSP